MFRNVPFASIVLYISGLLVFHTYAVFDNYWWKKVYYIWSNACDLLFIISLYQLIPSHRKTILYIIIYAVCRLVFRIADLFLKLGDNHKYIVNTLFLVALGIISFLTLRQALKEWKLK